MNHDGCKVNQYFRALSGILNLIFILFFIIVFFLPGRKWSRFNNIRDSKGSFHRRNSYLTKITTLTSVCDPCDSTNFFGCSSTKLKPLQRKFWWGRSGRSYPLVWKVVWVDYPSQFFEKIFKFARIFRLVEDHFLCFSKYSGAKIAP